MNQRERTRGELPPAAAAASSGEPDGANLNVLRQSGAALLAAADEAIARVLSGDSQAFNEAARQQGGQ